MRASLSLAALALSAVALDSAAAQELAKRNVLGGTLERCSGTGMALTGFTRSGSCVDHDDDAGSHHVCIDMGSATGGNFCAITGQPNWCDSQMPCDGNSAQRCKVDHWCVCEWAFASYIERAGGCDRIQSIVCEATNMAALKHYREQADTSTRVAGAMACLEKRCGL